MATNYVQIFDDTVIKQSIKQGTEAQRLTDTLGMFTIAELAYTRDTARVFSGDYYNNNEGAIQTEGGTLVGNKYLGMIDSRYREVGVSGSEIPLSYTSQTNYQGIVDDSGVTKYENALLGRYSTHKLENGNDDGSKEWNRTTGFNSEYSAYNGDFVYDKFQNALVLFDKRIKTTTVSEDISASFSEIDPDTGETVYYDEIGPTPFINYISTNGENDQHPGSFGDGYVIFKNVIPDNVTIQYKEKFFDSNGKPTTNEDSLSDTGGYYNYNNNVLEIKSVPTTAMSSNFSDNFSISTNSIDLASSLTNINSISGLNTIMPTSETNISTLKIGTGTTYLVFGTNAINFNGVFSEYNSKDTFTISLNKVGTTSLNSSSIDLYRADLINLSSLISGIESSDTRSTFHMLDTPVPLAWTATSEDDLDITIRNSTDGGHINALLEYKITEDDIFCGRKYLISNDLPTWDLTNNLTPFKDPTGYFSQDDFASATKGFHLWNTGLMVRGNNSFASLGNISDDVLSTYACVDNNPNLGDFYTSDSSVVRSSFVGYGWDTSNFSFSSNNQDYEHWREYVYYCDVKYYFTIEADGSNYNCYATEFSYTYKENDTDGESEYIISGVDVSTKTKLKSLTIDDDIIFSNGSATATELAKLVSTYGFIKITETEQEASPYLTETDDDTGEVTNYYNDLPSGYILTADSTFFKSRSDVSNPFYNFITEEVYLDEDTNSFTTSSVDYGNSSLICRTMDIVRDTDGNAYLQLPNQTYSEALDENDIVTKIGYVTSSGTTYTNVTSSHTKVCFNTSDTVDVSNSIIIPSDALAVAIHVIYYESYIDDDNKTITTTVEDVYYLEIINSYYQYSSTNINDPSVISFNGVTYNEALSAANISDLSNANSVLLSLETNYESGQDVGIFNAYKFDRLKYPSSGVISTNGIDSYNTYQNATHSLVIIPDEDENIINDTFSITQPTTIVNDIQFIPGANEIKLTSQLFEVPVDAGLFNLRLANINYPGCTSNSSDTLILKLIGYKL